jgi:hypothetical protein
MKSVKRGFLLAGVISSVTLLLEAAQAAVFRFSPVADISIMIPGGTGSFDFFGPPMISGDAVVFEGSQRGSGFGFGQSVIRGNRIVFQAGRAGAESDVSGLYTSGGDELVEVIATGGQIQGKTVSSLEFGSSGWSGNRLVFRARFEDGSAGIFEAQPVPAPASTLGLAVLGALGAGSLARRRLKQRFGVSGASRFYAP